jgi:exopolysaccharide biosynthesis polyprenyl glycosylphosphotransferase
MYRKYNSTINKLMILLADILVIEASYVITMTLRMGAVIPAENFNAYLNVSPWINIVSVIVFYVFDLYSNWTKRDLFHVMVRLFSAILVNTVLTISIIYITRNTEVPRSVVLGNFFTEILMLGVCRYLIWRASQKRQKKKPVMVIGEFEEDAISSAANFRELSQSRYAFHSGHAVQSSRDLQALLEMHPEVEVVAAKTQLFRQSGMLEACFNAQKEILIIPDILNILLKTAKLQILDDKLLFNLNHFSLSPIKKNVKRIFDLLAASGLLILLSPAMLVVAILIPLTSPGPVFYRQERLGENNKKFNIIKFRSMIRDAESKTGPTLASSNDPRITRFGAFLREYRLDELPQLFNVIKGDMSIVGPRPEREFFVSRYLETVPFYRYRMLMKPGITGLAQVLGKYSTTVEGKLQYDLMYISSYSLLLDLRILMETVRAAFHKENAAGLRSDTPSASEK